MIGCIYSYTSPSGKMYIGQTVDEIRRRCSFMNSVSYGGVKIDNARRKYGPENFDYKVLVRVSGSNVEQVKSALNTLEIGFIRLYDTYRNGYNSTEGGSGYVPVRKHRPGRHKKKISPCKGKHWKLIDGKRVWY